MMTAPPAGDVITIEDLKRHCQATSSFHDAYITDLRAAAMAYVEGYTGVYGRALLDQTWSVSFDCFGDRLPIPLGPVRSIVSLNYFDSSNLSAVVNASVYQHHSSSAGAYVSLNSNKQWPQTYNREDAVTLTWVAGFGADAAAVPANVKQAIRMLVAHWFRAREPVSFGATPADVPETFNAILGASRRTPC